MAVEGTALRKRQQITKANRIMFTWIAGASIVVGIALVASIFLAQKLLFNEKVLGEKSKTASTLVKNNQTVEALQEEIRVLNTNDDLKGTMLPGQDQPVEVVLDALPAQANSAAFGSSLQRRFLEAEGIRLESLDIVPVPEVETVTYGSDDASDVSSLQTSEDEYQIRFNFAVSADRVNTAALQNLLVKLERSIRPIDLTHIILEVQGDRLVLRAEGRTYYQPTRTAELTDKVVKP